MPETARSPRWRWPATAVLAIAVLAGCVGLDTQQRKWIFQASAAAQAAQVADMDDVFIEHRSADSGSTVRLHALWYANDDPQAPLLLYLHGARRNVDESAFRIRHMQELGFSVLAVEYRGFGRSTDELPSEATVAEDARAAWDWMGRMHPSRDRYIFGHSLGGAIAVQLATDVPDTKGLIVEGTFTSIPEVFQSFRWGWLPITALITQRFDSVDKIGRVKVPVLVVHGSRDSLIPASLGRSLYERAKDPKRFVLVEGGSHYSTNRLANPQYRQALKELFGIGTGA